MNKGTKLIVYVQTDGKHCDSRCSHNEDNGCNLFEEELKALPDSDKNERCDSCLCAETAPW